MRAGRPLLFLIALGLGTADARAETPLLLTCGGPFAKEADAAALATAFGAENVRKADIEVGEGATEPGTLVFSGDPKRRLEVLWHDNEHQRRPAMVRVGEGSEWRVVTTPGQIRVGMLAADVEKLNGRPFTIVGFEWDYGGYASNFSGGKLGQMPGGCVMGLRFSPDPKAGEKAMLKVVGDVQFHSSAPVMRAVKPFVGQMTIGWPE